MKKISCLEYYGNKINPPYQQLLVPIRFGIYSVKNAFALKDFSRVPLPISSSEKWGQVSKLVLNVMRKSPLNIIRGPHCQLNAGSGVGSRKGIRRLSKSFIVAVDEEEIIWTQLWRSIITTEAKEVLILKTILVIYLFLSIGIFILRQRSGNLIKTGGLIKMIVVD